MNVGLVVPGFSADDHDWCIPALRHLARCLATTDDVRVVAVRYPYRAARYPIDGADVIAVGGAATRGAATLAIWRRTLQVLRDEHRRRPFDVLHGFWATESGLLTVLAGRLLRIPTLVSLAGGELARLPEIGYGDQRVAWERLKIRASLRLASAVSVGSEYLRSIAVQHVPAQRLHRAPLGVDTRMFAPPANPPPSQVPTLIHAGTLTNVKDQVTLLRAFARFGQRAADWRLDIAGDGPRRDLLQRLAGELGLADRITFRGDVDHGALPAVYAAGRAFVLSSRHEAQGMVAVEAAACGLPIVGTRVGVVPELAAGSAAVAPVADVEALAEALETVRGARAGEASGLPERTRAEFSLEACTARFRALYGQSVSAG